MDKLIAHGDKHYGANSSALINQQFSFSQAKPVPKQAVSHSVNYAAVMVQSCEISDWDAESKASIDDDKIDYTASPYSQHPIKLYQADDREESKYLQSSRQTSGMKDFILNGPQIMSSRVITTGGKSLIDSRGSLEKPSIVVEDFETTWD